MFSKPSKAQQNPKQETDINHIMGQYLKTGILGNPNATRKPIFGDFRSRDFQEMQNALSDVQQNFASLPSRIRGRFNNDPYQLLRFVEDPANQEEAIKMKLASPPPQTYDEAYNAMMEAAQRQEEHQRKADEQAATAARMDEIRAAFASDPEANPRKAPKGD